MKQTGTAIHPQQTTNVTKSTPGPQEQIRLRAYGLYEQRGRAGNELDDWLQAESDLTQPKPNTIVP